MSLITRCPACTTMFKVVPDQLRVSEGWVRCGQCGEVFDANLHLQAQSDAVSAPAVMAADEVPPTTVDTGQEYVAPAPPVAEPFLEVNPRALYIDPLEVEPPTGASKAATAPQEPHLEADAERLPDAPQMEVPEASEPEAAVEPQSEPEAEAFHHTFLNPSGVPAKRSSRVLRIAWVMLACLLSLGLLVQVLLQERDRIVAMEPAARHVLAPLCAVVGCILAPLRQIESVVIDSSAFTKLRGDVYRLNFTLKSTTQLPLATPSLELTLTDLQDQAVVRRVFQVGEFAPEHALMEAGAELPAVVTLKVSGVGEKVSGYRLLSFYP